jgi:hypothetical protein
LKEAQRPAVVVRLNPRDLNFVVFGVLIGTMVLLERLVNSRSPKGSRKGAKY